ncbi:hypothetical protein K435DRAFT_564725, partial [Dendrothele bispora CBS 962.96]
VTTEMSWTEHLMLPLVHLVFRDLQHDIKANLSNLPSGVPSEVKEGLVAVHQKLSDYYMKYNESPFYI